MTKASSLRKYQQISKTNRIMFIWVAGASAVVGIAIVVSIFLGQKLLFNEKILTEKNTTASILKSNNDVVTQLKDNVRVLNTNQALIDSKNASESEPVQVVLDALPADANSSALGASLQDELLKDDKIRIESLVVDPVYGVESDVNSGASNGTTTSSDATAGSEHAITFRFSVSARTSKAGALRALLNRLERSIRAIDVSKVTLETQGSRAVLSVDGKAFYEPAKSIELQEKTVRP